MFVCNKGKVATFIDARREHVRDLTMANEYILRLIQDWNVSTEALK